MLIFFSFWVFSHSFFKFGQLPDGQTGELNSEQVATVNGIVFLLRLGSQQRVRRDDGGLPR